MRCGRRFFVVSVSNGDCETCRRSLPVTETTQDVVRQGGSQAYDCDRPLAKIVRGRRQPINSMLLDIQTSKIQHGKSLDFVRHLECLRPSGQCKTDEDELIQPDFSRERINAFQNEEYMAVSYTWDAAEFESRESGGYLLESRGETTELSNTRNIVFDRAIPYMRYFGIENLWIDRECIVQEPGVEKEIAINAMDLVYQHSKYPVALLARRIETELELHLLTQLLEGDLAYKNEQDGSLLLGRRQTRETVWRTLKLLEAITSDRWWTRAWTFQENYRGGIAMRLLIPHADFLESQKAAHEKVFGGLRGELDISSAQFHEVVTILCLAFEPKTVSEEGLVEKILLKAGRYSVLLQDPDQNGVDVAMLSMSPIVVEDIMARDFADPWDCLAIIANCCQYSVRLNSLELKNRGCSLSVSILALLLLNGEILRNAPNEEPGDGLLALRNLTLTDFLQTLAFDKFSPPDEEFGLTFNKGCRFFDVTLSLDGLQTHGHLWCLHRVIEAKYLIPRLPRNRSTKNVLRNLVRYIRRLGESKLASALDKFLHSKQRSRSNVTRYQPSRYMWTMAKELASAVFEGKALQLGSLWNSSGVRPPSQGIFICHDEGDESEGDESEGDDSEGDEGDDSERYAFTAFRPRSSGSSGYSNDLDRHVSLEVDIGAHSDVRPRLYVRRWIHGLSLVQGSPQMDVTFPWPRVLTDL